MVERGLTGQVVAARVIDRLGELQSQTNTAAKAQFARAAALDLTPSEKTELARDSHG
jgi:hypothetical protein